MFEVEKLSPPDGRHFGLMVRDEDQLAQVRAVFFVIPSETELMSSIFMMNHSFGCCRTRKCRRPEFVFHDYMTRGKIFSKPRSASRCLVLLSARTHPHRRGSFRSLDSPPS